LRLWKAACAPAVPGQADWCFPSASGGPIDQYNFRSRTFLPALRRAKLRRVRIHDLRHGCGMGHANVAVTLGVYSHWFARRQDSGLGARLEAFVEKEIGCDLVAIDPIGGKSRRKSLN
jgi:integrase